MRASELYDHSRNFIHYFLVSSACKNFTPFVELLLLISYKIWFIGSSIVQQVAPSDVLVQVELRFVSKWESDGIKYSNSQKFLQVGSSNNVLYQLDGVDIHKCIPLHLFFNALFNCCNSIEHDNDSRSQIWVRVGCQYIIFVEASWEKICWSRFSKSAR